MLLIENNYNLWTDHEITQADKGCYFITSSNLVVVEAKEEEKIADPCDRDKCWVFSNRKMPSCHNFSNKQRQNWQHSSNFSEAEFNPMRDRYGDFNTIELKMTSTNVTSENFSFYP